MRRKKREAMRKVLDYIDTYPWDKPWWRQEVVDATEVENSNEYLRYLHDGGLIVRFLVGDKSMGIKTLEWDRKRAEEVCSQSSINRHARQKIMREKKFKITLELIREKILPKHLSYLRTFKEQERFVQGILEGFILGRGGVNIEEMKS